MKCKICKCHKCGVPDKTAKQVDVPCFALDVDKGSRSFDTCVASTGNKVAYALSDGGMSVLPSLEMAEIFGWHAHGFRVRGVCQEMLSGKLRRFYCEWWVTDFDMRKVSRETQA